MLLVIKLFCTKLSLFVDFVKVTVEEHKEMFTKEINKLCAEKNAMQKVEYLVLYLSTRFTIIFIRRSLNSVNIPTQYPHP